MSLLELFVIAIGLSMDAFSVAICKGLSMKRISIRKAGIVSLYFGTFQSGMPLIGYYLGIQFQDKITFIDHWIAFVLLGFIGIKMIIDSRKSKCQIAAESLTDEDRDDSLDFKNMSVLAIATSIDALAVGITFAFLKVNIALAVSFIGIVTFTLSMIGVRIGNVFGAVYKSKAEFAGGLILIVMGTKLLLNHLGLINF
ncbi:manganese efflux pump MntP [Clostridium tagluense]|uniref:manganese efflux pump MntP n=1 Tax=Clostridium tagluense TaxID=360422 RepID=UPI001C6E5735|nr:manganese efflux pump MntP family protein [Clostridium tagluense]MBW9158464.1 manganese efflux pump MntP family protein [Clostridium tagluense]WLC67326.1 manganese efflux pump MntP family protein [Clostridium tagluense]